jgi:predicted NodU family carbamoyl transferase
MKSSLCISLGHNSSAILIQDGNIEIGYETERFSQKKSDSGFPCAPIEEIMTHYDLPSDTDVYVSHWMLDGKLVENKYWDPSFIKDKFPDGKVFSLIPGTISHHDAHCIAAQVFAGVDWADNYHIYVMDGFGTAGEVISIYHVEGNVTTLQRRVFGFHNSLGMWYQYSTAFSGMEMNNHEMKNLAYETRITNVPVDIDKVNDYILEFSTKQFKNLFKPFSPNKSEAAMDPMISLDALVNTREFVEVTLSLFLDHFGMSDADILTKRILVAYFTQTHVENVVLGLNNHFMPKNLLLSGGFFLNVKINHMLAQTVDKICVYPLAGDAGAALGVYQYYNGDLIWPNHLFFGKRTLDYDALEEVDGIWVVDTLYDAHEMVKYELNQKFGPGFVNIINGSVEYGPRALCNTTTLALPKSEIAEQINKMNDRTNEMPFALTVTEQQANEYFEDIYKVHKSLEYMVITRKFRAKALAESVIGGAHYYPLTDDYTCRPQIARSVFMTNLLAEFGPLINTSFNYHGVPIVMTTEQIIYTHTKERAALPTIDFKTIIIKE